MSTRGTLGHQLHKVLRTVTGPRDTQVTKEGSSPLLCGKETPDFVKTLDFVKGKPCPSWSSSLLGR